VASPTSTGCPPEELASTRCHRVLSLTLPLSPRSLPHSVEWGVNACDNLGISNPIGESTELPPGKLRPRYLPAGTDRLLGRGGVECLLQILDRAHLAVRRGDGLHVDAELLALVRQVAIRGCSGRY